MKLAPMRFRNHANFALTRSQLDLPSDLSGFVFGDGARFDGAVLIGVNSFERTSFGYAASFVGALFGDKVNFREARFGNAAWFVATRFGFASDFTQAQFGSNSRFDFASFGDWTDFSNVIFHRNSSFLGVQFGVDATFSQCIFVAAADFSASSFERHQRFHQLDLDDEQKDAIRKGVGRNKKLAKECGLSPQTFESICFSGSTFCGEVIFSGREFKGETKFDALKSSDGRCDKGAVIAAEKFTEFKVAPTFHNCKVSQDTSFEGAIFPAPASHGDEAAARAYRTLKLAFSQLQATREEQRFFRLEMDEERQLALPLPSWLKLYSSQEKMSVRDAKLDLPPRFYYRVYKGLSDYGFSMSKPAIWLLFLPLVLMIFLCLLGGLLNGDLNDWIWNSSSLKNDLLLKLDYLRVSVGGAFPFLPQASAVREDLFGCSFTMYLMRTLATLQSLLALLGWFLMGLAVRNQFKMK